MKTLLDEISPDGRTIVGSSALKECCLKNDELVVKAISRAAAAPGITGANIINLIGVEALIYGGDLIEEFGDLMIKTIEEMIKKHSVAV